MKKRKFPVKEGGNDTGTVEYVYSLMAKDAEVAMTHTHLFPATSRGDWLLSPAYDLTFSSGPQGEQSTMVLGEGKHPRISHLIELGHDAKIEDKLINEIIEQTQESLSQWKILVKNHCVSNENTILIEKQLRSIQG